MLRLYHAGVWGSDDPSPGFVDLEVGEHVDMILKHRHHLDPIMEGRLQLQLIKEDQDVLKMVRVRATNTSNMTFTLFNDLQDRLEPKWSREFHRYRSAFGEYSDFADNWYLIPKYDRKSSKSSYDN